MRELNQFLTILSRIPNSLSIIDQSRRSLRNDPHCWMVAHHDECVQVDVAKEMIPSRVIHGRRGDASSSQD